MSTKRTDTNSYTLIFSVILVVVVGSLLAFFANATKEMRDNNDKVKTQMDILTAMGVDSDRTNATEVFNQYIKQQFVIEGEKVTDNKLIIKAGSSAVYQVGKRKFAKITVK